MLVAGALPVARAHALLGVPAPIDPDATLQAFADTIIPGRKADRTDLGNEIDPRAIAGVDPQPGAVEADALRALPPPADRLRRARARRSSPTSRRARCRRAATSSTLRFDDRVAVLRRRPRLRQPGAGGLGGRRRGARSPRSAPPRSIARDADARERPSGYRVMGLPGAAPERLPRLLLRRAARARAHARSG